MAASAALCTAAALASVLFFSSISSIKGEPNSRQSRIIWGPYSDYYATNYHLDKSYWPGNYYKTYSYGYSKPNSHNDDKVYITDRYGRTTIQNAGSYAATQVTTCTASTCGQNAQCSIIGGRPVCSCLRGHTGDPLAYCKRAECETDYHCRGHLTCREGRCVDACAGTCGANADCATRNHVAVCTCPPGYTGDPFTSCRRFDPAELCHPSPCGPNTNCEVVNGVPTCRCLPGFQGSPLAGCRHECETDGECAGDRACVDFKCQSACKTCGESAECTLVQNHRATCKCPKGYFGNPAVSCKPECYGDVDCPRDRPACFYGECRSPCVGACGVGANCELRGLTPVCSCPRDMTGDPFVRCRPFEASDLCEPNPCGANARCEPGFDRSGKERPVCFCHTGYTGDPVRGCVRGECQEDSHCPDNKACINYSCQNPCSGQCGINANCNPRRHLAVCTCPEGYNGDALVNCYLDRGAAASRYLRYKKK